MRFRLFYNFALEMSVKRTNNGDILRRNQYEATDIKKKRIKFVKIDKIEVRS